MAWLKWVAFGAMLLGTLLAVGLDAADAETTAEAVEFVVERVVVPQMEEQWVASRPPPTSPPAPTR